MKKVIIILIAAALLTSCNNWLAEKPESFIGPDQIEDSEDGVDVWVPWFLSTTSTEAPSKAK